jgi:hypothetical protein
MILEISVATNTVSVFQQFYGISDVLYKQMQHMTNATHDKYNHKSACLDIFDEVIAMHLYC